MSPIDPLSDESVLFHNGGQAPRDVPARDLHGGDLNRIVYQRKLWAAQDALTPGEEIERPGIATAAELEDLATELSSTGSWARQAAAAATPPVLVKGDTVTGTGPIAAAPIVQTAPPSPAPPAKPEA